MHYSLLLSGELNLSTLSTAAGIVNEENVSELLKRISGRSNREVEAIVCELQEKPRLVRESVKPVAVRKAVPKSVDNLFSAPVEAIPTKPLRSHQWSQETPPPPVEKRFGLQFSLTEEAMGRFRRVQALLSNRLAKGVTIESTVDALATEFRGKATCFRDRKRGLSYLWFPAPKPSWQEGERFQLVYGLPEMFASLKLTQLHAEVALPSQLKGCFLEVVSFSGG